MSTRKNGSNEPGISGKTAPDELQSEDDLSPSPAIPLEDESVGEHDSAPEEGRTNISSADDVNIDENNSAESPKKSLSAVEPDTDADEPSTD